MKIIRTVTASSLAGSALLVGGLGVAALASAPTAMAAPRVSPAVNIVEYGTHRLGMTAVESGATRAPRATAGATRAPGATVIEY